MMTNYSFNSIKLNFGSTELSFLFFLKIIFFILFILLNIGLIYSEYLDKKQKSTNNSPARSHLQAGISPELRRISGQFLAGIGGAASVIAIKNE